ncbi:MAG: hypothetical protein PHX51_03525 [Clostridia bacterium]|nr:hypothetical protein [Clostridia bacterium]
MFNKVSIKAIIVLVVIAVLSGVLLSVLYGVLYVSEEEKEQNALKKVYDGELTERPELNEKFSSYENKGKVTKLFRFEDALIVDAVGYGGYGGGWVECYVVIGTDGAIKKVAIVDNNNQSFVGNVTEAILSKNYGEINLYDIEMFKLSENSGSGTLDWSGIVIEYSGGSAAVGEIAFSSGASYTETAVMNAVNSAVYYIKNVYPDVKSFEEGWL